MTNTNLRHKVLLITSGIILSLVIIETIFAVSGAIYVNLIERRNRISLAEAGEFSLLFLGESTTSEGGWNSYPREVGRILNQRLPKIRVSIINKGVPAVNTSFVLSELDDNLKKYNPHMVVVMMGINDNDEDGGDARINPVRKLVAQSGIYKLLKTVKMKLREKEILIDMLLTRGNFAVESRNYLKAERLFKKVIEMAPDKEYGYIVLGNCYLEERKVSLALETLKKALSLNPLNTEIYLPLASAYKMDSELYEAERIFKKAAEFPEIKEEALIELAWLYYPQGKVLQARGLFHKLLDMYPESEEVYMQLAKFYQKENDCQKAEDALRKAMDLSPKNEQVYIELAHLFVLQGRSAEKEEVLKNGIEINPYAEDLYVELRAHYKKINNLKEEEEIRRKIETTVWDYYYYPKATVANYRALKEKILQKGIQLVCVQYPRRSVKPLKEILVPEEGVIFVDNQKIFADAIGSGTYDDLFVDRFAGDFGHCTPKGNELLAKNVAEVLLKEYFLKN